MKTYKLQYDKRYIKELKRIPISDRKKIRDRVESLACDPRPNGYLKLSGSNTVPLYRIRCGDYRVVYTVKDHALIVMIIELGHRREIYRKV